MEAPGAKVVKAPASAATLGTYLALIPVKAAPAPWELVMEKVFAGSFDRGLLGSFNSLTVSSPVFVMVAVTLRSSTVLTDSGPEDVEYEISVG